MTPWLKCEVKKTGLKGCDILGAKKKINSKTFGVSKISKCIIA